MAKVEEMKIDQLVPDDHNFNEGTEFGQHLMEKSFREFGAGRSILLDKNNRIISGNKSTETAADLGFEKVIVVETEGDTLVAVRRTDIDLDTERGRGMALADNVTAKENIKFNLPVIEDVTKDMDLNPADWGIDLGDIDLGIKDAQEDDFDENSDDVPARAALGDIWQLGRHRLMCGDSTNGDDVEKLMNGDVPNYIYTDPPYGMNAVSNSGVLKEKYKTDIYGDDDNHIAISSFNLVQKLFPSVRQVWWGANYYTECLPSSECWLVWDKNNGMSDQTDCELAWSNFRSVVRQFTMASEKTNRVHPTQKPVKLFAEIYERMKKNEEFSKVLDLFGGSGSTLIACEQMGICSFVMEYDSHYCDVIIARWEKLTGKKAELLNRE